MLLLLDSLKWSILEQNKKYLIAYTYITAFSWGEEVTIIYKGDELLFNSRPTGSQPYTINRDKVNFSKFKNLLLEKGAPHPA